MQCKSKVIISKGASNRIMTPSRFFPYLIAILLTLTSSAHACGPPYVRSIHPASCIQTSGCNEHTLEASWSATLLYFGSGNFCTAQDERAFRSMYLRANKGLLLSSLAVIAFPLAFTFAWKRGGLKNRQK